MLATPIEHGMCKYSDIYTLSLEDFLIMFEMVAVKNYNESISMKDDTSNNKTINVKVGN